MSGRAPSQKQSRIALSIRVLMGAILVLSVPLAWLANKARVQRQAVFALAADGVSVTYDYDYADGKYDHTATPWGPSWLRRMIGDEYFQEVAEVALLKGKTITDEHFAILAALPHLRQLYARSSAISDAGLRHLEGLGELESLHIGDTAVGDAGMASIGRLNGLKELILEDTAVSDIGLEHLKGLIGLRVLLLNRTKVSEAGVAGLKKSLPGTKISWGN